MGVAHLQHDICPLKLQPYWAAVSQSDTIVGVGRVPIPIISFRSSIGSRLYWEYNCSCCIKDLQSSDCEVESRSYSQQHIVWWTHQPKKMTIHVIHHHHPTTTTIITIWAVHHATCQMQHFPTINVRRSMLIESANYVLRNYLQLLQAVAVVLPIIKV